MSKESERMIEMLNKPGTYTIVVDRHLNISRFIHKQIERVGTYSFMVDNNFEISTVTINGKMMKKTPVQNSTHNPQGPQIANLPKELDVGCVGLGGLVPDLAKNDQCRFAWGTWF